MYLTVCEIDSNKVINHIHSRIELKIIEKHIQLH